MKKKTVFYTELAYMIGLILLAIGTAMMESADLGMSMVVAPSYVVYLKLSTMVPFLTFGMAEYMIQALLLVAMIIALRQFRIRYLFAFVTALIYGVFLDVSMCLMEFLSVDSIVMRVFCYVVGLIICASGISLFFHTYLSPEVYELFVKEISDKYGFTIHKCKTCYDCISCLVAILLSFLFFGVGHFEGVKMGTIFCTFVNGWLIGQCSRLFEARFVFQDKFKKLSVQE